MNETFAECYIMDKDMTVINAVFQACKDDMDIIRPELVKKANGNHVVMCGFEDKNRMQMVVGRMEKKFPGKLSWR